MKAKAMETLISLLATLEAEIGGNIMVKPCSDGIEVHSEKMIVDLSTLNTWKEATGAVDITIDYTYDTEGYTFIFKF